MHCREIEFLLIDYLDGETSRKEKRIVEAHLKDCPACRKDLRDYIVIDKLLNLCSPSEREPLTPKQSLARIWARIKSEEKEPPPEPSDLELMLQVKADNREAFTELFNRYQDKLHRFFLKSFPQEEAEDLTQEVFQRLWEGRYRYQPLAGFRTYLFTIAKNKRISRIRKAKNDPLAQKAGIDKEALLFRLNLIPDTGLNPAEALLAKERNEQMREFISLLPPDQGDVMNLVWAGLTEVQISKELGCPRTTISSRKKAGMEKLRQMLAES